METLTVTLETAKKLKAAGFPQDALEWWGTIDVLAKPARANLNRLDAKPEDGTWGEITRTHYAAPTAQELADQLPPYHFAYKGNSGTWYVGELIGSPRIPIARVYEDMEAPTMAEALAALWLKLQETK